jgi:hypothetical protein
MISRCHFIMPSIPKLEQSFGDSREEFPDQVSVMVCAEFCVLLTPILLLSTISASAEPDHSPYNEYTNLEAAGYSILIQQ